MFRGLTARELVIDAEEPVDGLFSDHELRTLLASGILWDVIPRTGPFSELLVAQLMGYIAHDGRLPAGFAFNLPPLVASLEATHPAVAAQLRAWLEARPAPQPALAALSEADAAASAGDPSDIGSASGGEPAPDSESTGTDEASESGAPGIDDHDSTPRAAGAWLPWMPRLFAGCAGAGQPLPLPVRPRSQPRLAAPPQPMSRALVSLPPVPGLGVAPQPPAPAPPVPSWSPGLRALGAPDTPRVFTADQLRRYAQARNARVVFIDNRRLAWRVLAFLHRWGRMMR
jgi:hypothetical protein